MACTQRNRIQGMEHDIFFFFENGLFFLTCSAKARHFAFACSPPRRRRGGGPSGWLRARAKNGQGANGSYFWQSAV